MEDNFTISVLKSVGLSGNESSTVVSLYRCIVPFQMVNAVTDVQEDTVVEVVISAQQLSEDDVEIRPHQLTIHSYKTPTFCHFCGEMLFGMFKQVGT